MTQRTPVLKTYKLFIGGKFPRTESGRYYPLTDGNGKLLANVCLGSRKDFRNAVVAARKAQPGWAAATAYLRSQILYRIGEILEGRTAQFVEELVAQGVGEEEARAEVAAAVDCFVYYAGWCDKIAQVFGSVNPVASPHFNFSVPEPTGVVAAWAPSESGLLGLAASIAPVICGGNSLVVLAAETRPLSAVTLGEVINTSDVPAGVVNILTGRRAELLDPMSTHRDVDGVLYCGDDAEEQTTIQQNAADTIRRVSLRPDQPPAPDPCRILDFMEIKTTWHPVGV